MRLLLRVPWLIRPRTRSGGTEFIDVASLDGESRRKALDGMDYTRAADADRVVLVSPSGYGWLLKDRYAPSPQCERSLTRREVERLRRGQEPQALKVKWTHHPSNRLSLNGYKAGRFGGGWQWCVGVKIARRCFIVELLVGSLRVTW